MNTIGNRELSWLQFNDRVLQEAQDKNVPLLQRLRFLGIFSNNQDEFIKVRVANLLRFAAQRGKKMVMTGDYTPTELLALINQRMEISQETFRRTYNNIITQMEHEGIYVVNHTQLSEVQTTFCREYFLSVISVRLVPIILRKSVALPFLPDSKIYLAVKMQSSQMSRYALVQMPISDACPRFVRLPSSDGRIDIIFLDDIIRLFLDDIFFMFNYDKISAYTFKIVRDAAFVIDDDVSKSMAEKMSQGIMERERGRAIRLIYDRDMPRDMVEPIASKLGLKHKEQIEAGGRYHLMRDLMRFPKVRPDLESAKNTPMLHPRIDPFDSILKVIKQRDILLCYPYQTFNHMLSMLREAAIDPRVQSIYITLYRTANHSKVINALLNGVKNGKQVTALVELKARFDEEQNIDNTDILQEGGVKVITSHEMLKVHSKLVLIERTELGGTKGYVYVGTGNFNEDTSNIYSDFGLITADQSVAADARKVFSFLEHTHIHPQFEQLMVSPYYMRDQIMELIESEIRRAKKGEKATIKAKFNSLTDLKMIKQLYKASQAGVKIKLIVRGACCLKAGIAGVSDNIEVRSIVDKYLEHARMMIFYNGGKSKTYILSADLMTRNLDRRVEVGTIIRDRKIEKILHDYFRIQWKDNVKARLITERFSNDYVQRKAEDEIHRSQEELYKYFQMSRD